VKARIESLEMGRAKNSLAIQTGSRELPTLLVAYLANTVRYEILVSPGRNLHVSRDRNTGGSKMPAPDTPYMLASKTASSA